MAFQRFSLDSVSQIKTNHHHSSIGAVSLSLSITNSQDSVLLLLLLLLVLIYCNDDVDVDTRRIHTHTIFNKSVYVCVVGACVGEMNAVEYHASIHKQTAYSIHISKFLPKCAITRDDRLNGMITF